MIKRHNDILYNSAKDPVNIKFKSISGLKTSKPISPMSRKEFDQTVLDSLSGGGVFLLTFKDGETSLEYSHKVINHSRDLEVKIYITKKIKFKTELKE